MSLLDELAAHAVLPFDQARMLPVEAYTSTSLLTTEIDALFGRDWQCVGRTADLGDTGDYFTAQVPVVGGSASAARSVIVLRADDGEIRAFDNVCVHRGTQLLTGCGNEARLTCPYHAWVYRLDGSLVGGPYMQQSTEPDGGPFDPDAHQLSAVRTEIWEGLIFVNFDANAEPLTHALRACWTSWGDTTWRRT